jgi:hypothetical protein
MRVRVTLWLCALLALPSGANCASVRVPQAPPPGQAEQAPNMSEVTARVVNAVMVSSTRLGIQPEQPICVLTLEITSANAVRAELPAMPAADLTRKPVEVYTKTDLVKLKGGRLTATITMKGGGAAAHLWLVEVLSSSPPK